jgi:RHS repeat-associated protein
VDNVKSVSGDRSATYFYDEIYRVLNVASAKPEAFTYDGTGNRLSGPGAKDTGALPADISYLYNNANQLSRGRKLEYDYDNAGNQTTKIVPGATDKSWTQIWNLQNQLVTVEKIKGNERRTVTFKYDPFGRRIEKQLETVLDGLTTTSTWKYVYDNEDIAMEVLSDDSGESKSIFTHGPGIDEPLAMERDGAFYYYHADGLGSIAVITSATPALVQKYGYDSFGMVTPETGFRNSYTYTGREWDKETGLYYYRARYYDPMEGRFISKDPIGFAGGDVNLYGYVQSNPVNLVDPSGLAGYIPSDSYHGCPPGLTCLDPGAVGTVTDPSIFLPFGGAAILPLGMVAKTPIKDCESLKYAPRVRARGVEDPKSHNFPYSFDKSILSTKPILQKNGYNLYRLEGSMTGKVIFLDDGTRVQTYKHGVFEIGVTKDGVIDHRFFRPYE